MKIIVGTEIAPKTHSNFDLIYIQFDNGFFPYEGWEDFYIQILWDWISTICKAEKINCCDFRLDVMDGPHYLLCSKNFERVSLIGMLHETPKIIYGEMDFSALKNTIVSVSKEILQNAKNTSKCNNELDCLDSWVKVAENNVT